MPAIASWMLRIPRIIADLEQLTPPVVDRAVFERLFGVKRRRAIELMQRFGGYRSGNSVLVDRAELMTALRHLVHGADYEQEYHRKQKLVQQLDNLHSYRAGVRIALPVSRDVEYRTTYDLPADIRLEAGRLTVTFSTPEELFGKLYELGQAAVNDYDSVCRVIAGTT